MTADTIVVGGGASGALAAVQLARAGQRVTVVGDASRVGPGVAYGAAEAAHLLNVPAAAMSAFPDQPEHFLTWARRRRPSTSPATFLPRAFYGDYLTSVAADTAEHVRSRAVDAYPTSGGVSVRLATGAVLTGRQLVLALGNFPAATPAPLSSGLAGSSSYTPDPWAPGVLGGIPTEGDVLLVGTGLTAVDVATSLLARAPSLVVHAVSRHGLAPLAHLPVMRAPAQGLTFPPPRRASEAMALARRAVREAADRGEDWRAVMDALRRSAPSLWKSLPVAERERFLRLSLRHWEVHRHRVAPEIGRQLCALSAEERLVIRAGRLVGAEATRAGVDVTLRCHGVGKTLRVNHVVNCTAPARDPRKSTDPLVVNLLRRGLVAADTLGLGFSSCHSNIRVIGPARQGELWESTAIPEIREQAAALPRELAAAAARAI